MSYLTLIEEGFLYGDTLKKAVELAKNGSYNSPDFRSALAKGLRQEASKYKRWMSSDFSWETNMNEANQALKALLQGRHFSYKGVYVNLR